MTTVAGVQGAPSSQVQQVLLLRRQLSEVSADLRRAEAQQAEIDKLRETGLKGQTISDLDVFASRRGTTVSARLILQGEESELSKSVTKAERNFVVNGGSIEALALSVPEKQQETYLKHLTKLSEEVGAVREKRWEAQRSFLPPTKPTVLSAPTQADLAFLQQFGPTAVTPQFMEAWKSGQLTLGFIDDADTN